jgi:6-phosphogluconolactonase (cycloisomerase 2 family)
MPTNTRTPVKLSAVVALSLALAACGGNASFVCPLPASSSSSGTCTCGSGTAACPVEPGPEFLYATSTSGQILAFSIDHNTGVPSTVGSVPGPSGSFGITAVSNQFLYASDTQNAQLDGFSINQTTGALTALAESPFSTGAFSVPGDLAAPPGDLGSSPGSSLLYAADANTIDAFTISAYGVPTALSGSPLLAETNFSLTVDPAGRFLYAADDDPPGGVLAFTIDSTGALTAVPNSPFAIPGQIVANSLPSGIVDTGAYIYVALSSTDQIAGFSIASDTGALTSVPGSPFSAGTAPTTILLAGSFLYAINSLDGTISSYSVNASSGVLTPVSGSPFAISGTSMATDSFGEYLYIPGPSGIQAFSIDSASGALTPLADSPFPASGATLLTIVQIPPP